MLYMMEMTHLSQSNTTMDNSSSNASQSLREVWKLGDWLPITWIPCTEEELKYMTTVRARQEFLNDMFVDSLKEKYETSRTHN